MTEEKSIVLASHLEMIKGIMMIIDWDYLEESAKAISRQADVEDSTAALNRSYHPGKTSLLRKQSESLTNLLRFRKSLEECQRMKDSNIYREDMYRSYLDMHASNL